MKFKNFFKKTKKLNKKIAVAMSCLMISALASISAFAAEAGEAVAGTNLEEQVFEQAQASMQNLQSSLSKYLLLALGVGLAIFGAVIGIKKGIGWVKSLISKAS